MEGLQCLKLLGTLQKSINRALNSISQQLQAISISKQYKSMLQPCKTVLLILYKISISTVLTRATEAQQPGTVHDEMFSYV